MPTSQSCVVPVIDYEPRSDAEPPIDPVSLAERAQRVTLHPAASETVPAANAQRAAAAFADAALRRVLEVIDRRRPLNQLRPLLAAGLLDSLLLSGGRRDNCNAAQLRRVRVQLDATCGTSAEVAASYTRGDRIHAIACRIEQVRTATGSRWELVALHLG